MHYTASAQCRRSVAVEDHADWKRSHALKCQFAVCNTLLTILLHKHRIDAQSHSLWHAPCAQPEAKMHGLLVHQPCQPTLRVLKDDGIGPVPMRLEHGRPHPEMAVEQLHQLCTACSIGRERYLKRNRLPCSHRMIASNHRFKYPSLKGALFDAQFPTYSQTACITKRMAYYYCLPLLLLATAAMAVELVTYATDKQHNNLGMLQNTARWHGWSALHVIGTQEGFDSHGLVDKLRALRRFARKWPGDTILAFVDAYDVIINNEPAALETAFLSSGKRVLLASENGCCTDKQTALRYGTTCHPNWPFATDRKWLNSGVIVGYAKDIRRLLRMAWKEYRAHPAVYRAHTDQQLLCFLVSDGSTLWSRASVGIDHRSEMALTTYKTEIQQVLGFDSIGRMVFSNRTTPAIIHFNGPAHEKASQIAYAKAHLLLPTAATA